MQFGLFSNDRRPTRSLGEAWALDLREMATADRLGFDEAWMSEHQASADLLVARAAGATSRIRLGSAVRILPIYHPLQVANDAAACDQLTGGRYMLGAGPGFLPDKLIQRGIDKAETKARTEESLRLILRLMATEEPFDFEGEFWRGHEMTVGIPFIQKPHPMVALPVASNPASAALAGELGIRVITPDFTHASRLRVFGDAMEEGQAKAGRERRRDDLGACRVVYVGASDGAARNDMRDFYNAVIQWEIVNTPWHQADRIPAGGKLEDITFDYLVDSGNLFIGSADTVRQMIEAYFKETGGFGSLMLHAGRDYATPDKLDHSMELFMRDVVPRVRHLTTAQPALTQAERGRPAVRAHG
jgi:alkanesulfonate monooxygenase SsuD/methylene tetrahydromethanopterin reductase-like flavin-dependent oxidoreductase (luciferase family)